MNVLMESAIKISVVVSVALLACILLKSRSAADKHWVLAIVVACAWAMPMLSAVLPSWPGASLGRLTTLAEPDQTPRSEVQISVETSTIRRASVQREASAAVDAAASSANFSARRVAARIWLAGSVVSVLVLLAGLLRLRWLASCAQRIDEGPWVEVGEYVRGSYGLSSVPLLQSNHSSLLVTWGWRRPTILLPVTARQWPEDRIRIVLAHEFAHIARGDWVFQVALEGLRSVYWFNPLLWVMSRRLRAESERACDDEVLARGIEGSDYAAHLLALATSLNANHPRWLPAPAMARPSSLEGRIRAMLNTTRNRRRTSWSTRVGTIAALLALTVAVAGVGAQTQFYSLGGTVLDPSGRVLPDTRLVLTNPATRSKYEVRSDRAGHFEFVGLPPAQYSLQVSLPGFASLNETIEIADATERDLRLRVGSLEEMITVTDGAAPVGPPDPANVLRSQESVRRFAERAQREKARCAAGGAAATVGGNIFAPAKLVDVRPLYPDHLRAAKIEGTVTMDAVIGTDGLVRDIQHLKGPHPELEAAAADAVRQWQFSPTLLNCEAIDVEMKVTTQFTVER